MRDKKEIARSICEDIYGAGKLELFERYCAPNYRYHDPLAGDLSLTAEKEFVRALRSGFPDLRLQTERVFGEGDLVCVQWRATGTQRGEFMGIAASGRPIVITGVDVVRFENGKVVEISTQTDSLGFMQQLGVVPRTSGKPAQAEQARPS